MARFLDALFFIYFLTHIPISILVDFQAIVPKEWNIYPNQLVELKEWYCRTFRDSMMIQPDIWFKSFIFCEMFLQFPFFLMGTYGYFKGASKCKWLRIPAIIYGCHVATTLIPIFAHILLNDFSKGTVPGPRVMKERLTLMCFYLPYFLFPVALALDGALSSAYTQNGKAISNQKGATKTKNSGAGGKSKKVKAY